MELTLDLDLERVVSRALAEDIGEGDVTSKALLDPDLSCRATILLKETGVVCGLAAVEAVFSSLDPDAAFERLAEDGDDGPPRELLRVEGSARALLTGERTALNPLGRLCGIATLTRSYVDRVAGTSATILDTRKTTPGLRALEKYAVRCGGGRNHRFGLDGGVLVKDNHLRLAGGIAAAVERIRAAGTDLPIEVEAETLDEVRAALAAGADAILLDNMPPALLRQAVGLTAHQARLEASGGVTIETVREIAETGVDCISVGALTHSARSLDVSMEVE